MKRKYAFPLPVAALAVFGAGCDAPGPISVAPPPAATGVDVEAFFNPQPEPPGQVFRFELEGIPPAPGSDWRGSLFDPVSGDGLGDVTVETTSAMQRGQTLHLMQTWTLPEGTAPPDDVVELVGTLNLANGRLVLNSHPPTPGLPPMDDNAHVLGEATVVGAELSLLGDLMFNPQPEPPGLQSQTAR